MAGTTEILASKNPELLAKINSLENKINSLLGIKTKSRELKKRWSDVLAEYEAAINMAITYSARHAEADAK